jgi:hypothetical protein
MIKGQVNLPNGIERCTGYKSFEDQVCPERRTCERFLQIQRDYDSGNVCTNRIVLVEFPNGKNTCEERIPAKGTDNNTAEEFSLKRRIMFNHGVVY